MHFIVAKIGQAVFQDRLNDGRQKWHLVDQGFAEDGPLQYALSCEENFLLAQSQDHMAPAPSIALYYGPSAATGGAKRNRCMSLSEDANERFIERQVI